MPIDFEDCLTRGGDELLRFLHYCVYSVELAPVFVTLAGEYRLGPTTWSFGSPTSVTPNQFKTSFSTG